MLLFIGPEFIAHLLNRTSKGGHSVQLPAPSRARGHISEKPTISLKVKVTLIERDKGR
jgi:hypothetical protein